MLDGWDIDRQELPGYAPLPEGWSGPDAVLFEIPDSPFAYVVYNLDEIGMAKFAGNVALFRSKEYPARLFAPNCWYVWPSRCVIRCNSEANILLIYIASAYDPMEKYALVDLVARQFAPVFIPLPVAGYSFTQLGARRFAMMPLEGDELPYRRSYLIEPSALRWFDYSPTDGFDVVVMPSRLNPSVWHFREMAWQIVWNRAYQIAMEAETPNDARTVTDRVMERINMANLGDVLDRTVEYQSKPDEHRLRPLIERESATLHRER